MPCEPSGKGAGVGDEEPSGRGRDGGFPVLGEAAGSSEPGEGALHDPAPRQDDEAARVIGSLDDVQGPIALAFERKAQLVARVAAIGEDVPEPRPEVAGLRVDVRRAVTILDAGGMDESRDQGAVRIC